MFLGFSKDYIWLKIKKAKDLHFIFDGTLYKQIEMI